MSTGFLTLEPHFFKDKEIKTMPNNDTIATSLELLILNDLLQQGKIDDELYKIAKGKLLSTSNDQSGTEI